MDNQMSVALMTHNVDTKKEKSKDVENMDNTIVPNPTELQTPLAKASKGVPKWHEAFN